MPIGLKNVKDIIEEIMQDKQNMFMRLPQEAADLFEGDSRYRIKLDQDNCDYLYKTEDLVYLAGRKYDGKRNLIRKFKIDNQYEYVTFQANIDHECLDFSERWCIFKDCEAVESLRNEKKAFQQMLFNFEILNLKLGAIRIDNRMEAMCIAQILNRNTIVIHILKANPDMPGLYQVMLNEFLLKESGGFEYVNMEQDLGLEGLRKAKLSYHPVTMINKYTLERVNEEKI